MSQSRSHVRLLHLVLVRLMHKQSFKEIQQSRPRIWAALLFLIISRDIECAVIELLVSIAMVGNLFVDHLGVMDLTSKSIFINKDTNKRCESKA